MDILATESVPELRLTFWIESKPDRAKEYAARWGLSKHGDLVEATWDERRSVTRLIVRRHADCATFAEAVDLIFASTVDTVGRWTVNRCGGRYVDAASDDVRQQQIRAANATVRLTRDG